MFKLLLFILTYFSAQAANSQMPSRPGGNSPFSSARSSLSKNINETGLMTNEIFMPRLGVTSLLISLALPSGNIDSTASGGSVETKSGTETSFELAHGLTEKISIYGSFANLDRRSTYNTVPETASSSIGLGDTIIGIKGLSDKTANWFHYDLSFGSASKKPINIELVNGGTTPGSIRPSYNFKFGFGLPNPNFTFGLNYTYSLYLTGESSTTNSGVLASNTTHSAGAGMAWQFFIQSNTAWRYGFSYKEIRTSAYELNTGGILSTNNASTTLLPSIYLLTPMGPAADFIFSLYKPMLKNSSATQNYYLGFAQLRLLF